MQWWNATRVFLVKVKSFDDTAAKQCRVLNMFLKSTDAGICYNKRRRCRCGDQYLGGHAGAERH